ncbi:MAG: bacteriohemerythrin [Clostridia bacterium]|nr:bacteriohemerythrin [Clostridia bacterium]
MFKWRDSFSTNVAEIDNQHKKLFEIGSRLFEVASLKDDCDHYDEMMGILDELRDYTLYHFKFEENLMVENGYNNYENHKIEHDFFIKKLVRLEKSDLDNDQNESLIKMLNFVADWISSHILKTDMNYREHFNSRGVY